ncbi:protein of unknown function [Pseudomonas inefficax]|uniref:Uncharacterized protein n=1 Tax=Pseudomonas inefficax TaxID=2078786 RepID=A0AAQ1SRG8_9PSED|nr:protein of unknown function [Pseudomonas inefficax]
MQPIAGKPAPTPDRIEFQPCAVPVGAWLAGDGPQRGPSSRGKPAPTGFVALLQSLKGISGA